MTKVVIIRRDKLGKGSCEGILEYMQKLNPELDVSVYCHGKDAPLTEPADIYIRWGCTATVPRKVSTMMINYAADIHTVANKRGFRTLLDEEHLCPTTWDNINHFYTFMKASMEFEVGVRDYEAPRQFIVRKAQHARGKNLDFCESVGEVTRACRKYPEGGYYINEYIPKVAEFRVFVANGRAVCVTQKIPQDKDAIAWNRHQDHGEFDNVRWDDWNLEVVRVGCEAGALSGTHFAGVDVILAEDGNAYVLEANSAPTCSPYRQEKMAQVFVWNINNPKAEVNLGIPDGADNWRHYLHPAINKNAIVK